MLNQERWLEHTESYLKSLVAQASGAVAGEIDAAAPFGELGVDSFRVLKIIKGLEADFGTLPKTLLFENFNIESLARYFVEKHAAVVSAKFAGSMPQAHTAEVPASAPPVAPSTVPPIVTQAPVAAPLAAQSIEPTAIRLLESELPDHPELAALVRDLFETHKNEGCVSRGTRNIAPNLFIGSAKRGYFNYSRSGNVVLVYAYTGPEQYFPEIAGEMSRYCIDRGFQFNLFIDHALDAIDGVAFTATPFGVLQRVLDLPGFTLDGSAMRRLRYQVSKFEKAGACRTVEYACGSDAAVDRDIARIVERWCDGKTMVNPLIHIVKDEILAGRLHPQHRLFLTYLDDALQNVILISAMSAQHNGYLMDLEFYPREMPLGGLEFAIVAIIEALKAEGCTMLSLGGTYGCRLEASANADPRIDAILDDLHKQGIFNDEGNLQFKNKFRPENRTIYLCRPAGGAGADNVLDIIMMIADPSLAQTSEAENRSLGHASADTREPAPARGDAIAAGALCLHGNERSAHLARHGFNPLNLADDRVEFDLKTDSWAQLRTDYVARHIAGLRARLGQPVRLSDSLEAVFPFRHFVLTDAGRSAEHLLCKAWAKPGIVIQNLLFPTCLYHQIDKGFTPVELPHPRVFELDGDRAGKAELDWDALRAMVEDRAGEIAFVWLEVSDNASGGQPVSLAHLRALKDLLRPRGIALILDATRVLENALALIEHDPACAGRDLWDVAREMMACADAVNVSLAKDFGVDKGGLIATGDAGLFERLQELAEREGGGLDAIDKQLVALALHDREAIGARIARRVQATAGIWRALRARAVPVMAPAGGHCVLIDVKRIAAFAQLAQPVPSFLAWLYLATGIRAGAHSVGMQKNTTLNGLVRLAIPVGLKAEHAAEIGRRLDAAFARICDIPEIELLGTAAETFGDVHANYRLIGYREASAALVPVDAAAMPANAPATPVAADPGDAMTAAATAASTRPAATARADIAIVGMGGRYPKARSMDEFWDNLRAGRDCVGEMPAERLARRARHGEAASYRGGFIDQVDRFDSLFFNISPREAEVLDPQERLFLEVAWEALEDAGYYPELLGQDPDSRRVGVFVGAVWAMYQMLGVEEKRVGNPINPNSFLWSIANRVSFWMNFSGPSLTVDTACSSSLTALHLACEAIHNGDCTSAIVGGVNLDLHQHKYDINSAGGALSPDGLCRSFGAGANGYVAGEGVGAVVLKPLDRALADRDNIYGVIKGVVVNHGGRTSGYTVPSPKAQGELVAAALAKAGVDAASIGYIEAHGTGTELGDPIEIAGLGNAFAAAGTGVAAQSCPIGSVKTNIGHLEAAAGVVGVCKVLLQMRHGQLVPSLHSGRLNELIDFTGSPFQVQQRLQPWTRKRLGDATLPLRAGVSSFGAGGANAHAVIEHHPWPARDDAAGQGARLFPLSARNEAQLREMAQRLGEHLRRDFVAHRLDDIAYTLQHGRKFFEQRLVVIAASQDELLAKLQRFVDGEPDPDVLAGHAKSGEGLTRSLSRSEKQQFVDLLSRNRDPHKLAQLWIDGLLGDCRGFADGDGRRVSLPTYPFADKRHWIVADGRVASPRGGTGALHPLIDSNESTFQRQLFKKAFRASEFFLADHVVSGLPTLPGTAYLDLARKAGELAAGRRVRKIRNVTWASPLTAQGANATQAWIELKPAADAVLFEVFSEHDDGRKQLYAQGKLVFAGDEEAAAADEFVDLDAVRARCVPVVGGAQAYPLFETLGMRYGPSFQVLGEVMRNGEEVLARLTLPAVREADFDQFQLHPCLMDASMQAGIVAQLGDPSGQMRVPYSLGEVELLHPLTRTCYSYVTRGSGGNGAAVSRDDVTVLDETGKVLARIREAVGVPLTQVHEKPAAAARVAEEAAVPAGQEEFVELRYSHVWKAEPLAPAAPDTAALLLFDLDSDLRDALRARGIDTTLVLPGEGFEDRGDGVYAIDPLDREHHARVLQARGGAVNKIASRWAEPSTPADADALDAALRLGVHALMAMSQALIELKPAARVQIAYLHRTCADTPEPHHEAINGFARSLHLENPKLDCKVVELRAPQADAATLAERLLAELHADAQEHGCVRYLDGERQVRTLARLDIAPPAQASAGRIAFKQRGVYVLTGGAGGLGLIFAEYLAKRCKARLVLTGRSAATAAHEAALARLDGLGAQAMYLAADVSRAEDAQRVLDTARARYGRIDGIVHSAGVLRDSFLRNKRAQDLSEVLAPKVHGGFHLDRLSAGDDLDFFAMFSSLAALGGNTGQCDYAYANHYLDSLAARRESLRAQGLRHGRTLSLNWSLWADGGMKLDEQTELFFRKNLGIAPLDKDVGLAAFAAALSLPQPQIAVLQGVQSKIELAWGLVKKPVAPQPVPGIDPVEAAPSAVAVAARNDAAAASPASAGADLSAQVMQALSATVMDLLKLKPEDLSLDSILLDLGFDSIGLTTFANAINERYGLDINPVLFFEYPSLRAIAGVLASEHAQAVAQVHGAAIAASPAAAQPARATAPARIESAPATIVSGKQWTPPAGAGARVEPAAEPVYSRGQRFAREPIAIVGIAGAMPQSRDLRQFWEQLRDARDLVTEIPRDRWIWEDFHGNPLKEANKSYSKWGGFLNEVDTFDPLFFGITPREAEMMDPQQRIFIQTVWSAIEDAGHKVSDLSGTRTGLFVGVSAKDYIDVLAAHQSTLDGYSASGNSHSILANRVSYLFNLRGPSAPLDTACSSSLVALHRAIESIHTGSSEMAIVGGVQVMLTPVAHISLSSAGMLSPDGKCRTFNKDANGYVRGEGAGAVLLKPLARAQADGNPIYAVIRATAENHGGRVTNLTAPNPKAQAELLVEAYDHAGIDPTTVGYIECHGTGTSLGDPIEIQALKKSFADLYARHGKPPAATPHCGLSSVKTNIGHLEPAAGIASLLKALLAIKHRQIPALLHFEELNPYIDLKGSPFYIVDKTVDWQAPVGADGAALPRRAGVSSFGWGGANAHVVLEEYRPPQRLDAPARPLPIVLSAKNGERLKEYAQSLLAHLRAEPRVDLADLAYTLQLGRDPMNERLALMADSAGQLAERLQAYLDGLADAPVRVGKIARGKDDIGLIDQDPDIRASVIDKLLAAGKWDRLLELWVKGLELDWAALHAGGVFGERAPRRLSLPTYPFARERYWIDTSAKPVRNAEPAPAMATAPAAPVSSPEAAELMYFHERWQPRALAAYAPENGERVRLVFADAHGPRPDAGSDDSLILVHQGEAYARSSEREYRCRFGEAEDVRALLADLPADDARPLDIVYAWSRRRGAEGVHALFALLTAIKTSGRAVARVLLLGEYDPADAHTCWDYAWIGFERSLKLHLAKTEIALVYAPASTLSLEQALAAAAQGGVAWRRDGQWRTLSYAAHELCRDQTVPSLKHGGGYLITGGCGALGMQFARHLAAHGQVRLLLTGRSAMSPAIQSKLDQLLEAGAVQALYQAVDLGDAAATMQWASALPFELCGVIHAAGVESEQPFFEKSAADIERVLGPKTHGSRLLDEALAAQPLDFVCYFSSSSALLGDFGACDYAIANRYQMAYGEHRRQGGYNGRTVVINWPLWQQGGMGVADPVQTAAYLKRTGLEALSSEQGLAVWNALMCDERAQTLVMSGRPSRVNALLDRIYRVPAPPPLPPGEGRREVDAFLGAIRQQVRYRAADLNGRQIETIRQLIKAELLGLHEAEK